MKRFYGWRVVFASGTLQFFQSMLLNQALGLETIAPEPGPISAETAASLLRTAMQALLTPSFLGGAKTVYLRDAAIFNPLTEPGRFEAVKTQTAQLVEMLKAGLPDGVSLVVLTNQINKSTSFYKTFAASGEVHAFDAPEKPKEVQEDFIPAMEQLVKDRGLQMARPVLMARRQKSATAPRRSASGFYDGPQIV